MMSSAHGLSVGGGSVGGSSHGSSLGYSGHGQFEDPMEFSLERLIEKAAGDDADAKKRLKRRRKYELRLIAKHNLTEIDPRSDMCWYLIDSRWLNTWSAFIRDKGYETEPPGLLSSKDLLDQEGQPLPGLRAKIDYRGVTPMVFHCFAELYGRDSSPELCRYTVDIYAKALTPERMVKASRAAVMEARIEVNRLRPKWLKWERTYPDDDEEEDSVWCCGLTKEHLAAFVYWCIACWARRKSRGNISYRAYKPLQNHLDEGVSMHGNESTHSTRSRFSRGPQSAQAMSELDSSSNGRSRASSSASAPRSRAASRAAATAGRMSRDSSRHGGSQAGDEFGDFEGATMNPLYRESEEGEEGEEEGEEGEEDEEEEGEEDEEDDSSSDEDENGQPRFEVALADQGHESGNWFRPF